MRRKALKQKKKLESSPFWNPESTELKSGIQYTESGIHRVESRIQDCHGFPYMGRNGEVYVSKRLKKMLSIRIREKIMPTRNKPQKINMGVTISQYETSSKNNAHLLSRNLPAALLYTAYAR